MKLVWPNDTDGKRLLGKLVRKSWAVESTGVGATLAVSLRGTHKNWPIAGGAGTAASPVDTLLWEGGHGYNVWVSCQPIANLLGMLDQLLMGCSHAGRLRGVKAYRCQVLWGQALHARGLTLQQKLLVGRRQTRLHTPQVQSQTEPEAG